METTRHFDIGIIGAGASGLMAAIAASDRVRGERILLLEKNAQPGKKLFATGNGRCNFLNRYATAEDFHSREGGSAAEAWMSAAFADDVPAVLADLFLKLGIPSVCQDEGRMYPRSLQAESIVEALLFRVRLANVKLLTETSVIECRKEENGFSLRDETGGLYHCASIIVATGGKAGMQFGSSGDGYKIARSLGHRIAKPIPALTQIVLESPDASLAGVRVRGAISLWCAEGGRKHEIARDEGEIQLTAEGVSGICTFNISRYYEIGEGRSYSILMDFFPEYTPDKLLSFLRERVLQLRGRPARTFLNGLVPAKLAERLIAEARIDPVAFVESLKEAELGRIAKQCKRYERRAAGTKSWTHAQVTAGGVVLDEVNPKTMQSDIVTGLYFAGEVLDVDGPCGGFNLMWAFASGLAAGSSAGQKAIQAGNGRSSRQG